jgi:hypothetical protein
MQQTKSSVVDNFNQIANLLKFEDPNEFYFVQVLQRKKDHPELPGPNNRLIKAYYVYSKEKLMQYQEEIINLCFLFGARAYIHLNRRNAKTIALEFLAEVAHNIKSDHLCTMYKAYATVCGRHHSEKDKTWIIDVDCPSDKEITPATIIDRIEADGSVMDIWHFINEELEPINGDKLVATIRTKNGFHMITKPFNSQKFSEKYPNIDVHKNNPTVLYIPSI